MSFQDLFVGALTLKTQTFEALRERSDVFWRGFLVLLFAALVAGLFVGISAAVRDVAPLVTREQVLQQAQDSFNNSYSGPEAMRSLIEPYVTEIASMVYEITRLAPRAGEGARPVAAILDLIGQTLATPFTWVWAGWMLFAGLLFQLTSRWLGGRASMAQMLGLTALAAAPQVFMSLTTLLNLIATAANVPVLGAINSLLGFIIAVWSALIYVKATSVAQKLSIGRSLAAIVLGYVLLIAVFIVVVILFGILVGALIVPIAASTSR